MGEKDYKLFGGNFYGNIKCEKATKEVEPRFMKCNEKKERKKDKPPASCSDETYGRYWS